MKNIFFFFTFVTLSIYPLEQTLGPEHAAGRGVCDREGNIYFSTQEEAPRTFRLVTNACGLPEGRPLKTDR